VKSAEGTGKKWDLPGLLFLNWLLQLICVPNRRHGLGHVKNIFIWLLWATGSDVGWLRDVTLAVWQTLPNILVVADIALS
jgi:hypothetical protein